MILRNFGARYGRRALAAPVSRPCVRSLSQSIARGTAAPTTTDTAPPTVDDSLQGTGHNEAYSAVQEISRKQRLAAIEANYHEYERQRSVTHALGSRVESRYHPDQYLLDPPEDATLEMLMAAQCHMGHHISQWNSSNQRYIYGERAGIHIISLETTQAHLRRAARVVEEVAYYGGLILIAGTRNGHMPIVVKAAELAGACHLFQRWTPGGITNRDVILAGAPLKIVDPKDRELKGFHDHIRDRRPIAPDLVICLNPLENEVLLHECGVANIPTIGVIDTDADPTWVTYQIPANDDSLRSVTLLAGVLGRAGQRGQARRLAAAHYGTVTWETPADVRKYIDNDLEEKVAAAKKAKAVAQEAGILDDKPLRREDFMTDEELLREVTGMPGQPPERL